MASGLASFIGFRFALGLGEAGNWPGATKAVSEWFPRRESGWAVALFDSGSSVGGALAPWIVLTIYHWSGSWRPAFILTGSLGFVWLIVFRRVYRRPEEHPWITDDERTLIVSGRDDSPGDAARQDDSGGQAGTVRSFQPDLRLPYAALLRFPQTWGYVISKTFTDPVWFFITDWFAIYLVSRGYRIEESLVGFWVPFLAADLGNFFGGGFSSWLIARGWRVGAARKVIAVIGGLGMTLLVPAVWTTSFAGWWPASPSRPSRTRRSRRSSSTCRPTSSPPARSPASAAWAAPAPASGRLPRSTSRAGSPTSYSFAPILIGASVVPLVAMAAVLLLVRNTADTERGVLRPI